MSAESSALVTGVEPLVHAGRFDLAIAEFQRFAHERPDDRGAASSCADLLLVAGDAAAARGRSHEALAYLSVVADWRVAQGDWSGAAGLRARIASLEIADTEAQIARARPTYAPELQLRAARARACIARGDAVAAAEHLTPELANGDPATLLTIAEVHLRANRLDQGIALVEQVITHDPSLADTVARLGLAMAPRQPDAGFLLADMAARVWTTRRLWRAAASVFEDFAAAVPNYLPALARLRDIEAAASAPLPSTDATVSVR